MIKVLVVDDDRNLVEIFRDFFSMYYDIVDSTTDSVEASDLICKNNYDIIISDLEMPIMSGIDLFKVCREYSSNTKFFIVTGSSITINEDVDGVFRKPVMLKEIINAIKGIEST